MTRQLVLLASLLVAAPLLAQGSPTDPPIVGRRKVAAVLINMTNGTLAPQCTRERVAEEITRLPESAAAFYREASFGQVEIEVDVFGPITIARSTTDGEPFSTLTPLTDWVSRAEAVLAQQGVDLSPYAYRAMIFPRVEWTNGMRGCTGAWATTWGDVRYAGFCALPPPPASTYCVSPATMIHELGHTFGLMHASSDWKNDAYADTRARIEYGDPSDVMGGGVCQYRLFHPNGVNKYKLGWFASVPEAVVSAETMLPGERHTLRSIEETPSRGTGTQLLKLPDNYFLSTRSAVGFDKTIDDKCDIFGDGPGFDNGFTGRTSVHRYLPSPGNTLLVAVLGDGETFHGPTFDVTQRSHTNNSVTVELQPVVRMRRRPSGQ